MKKIWKRCLAFVLIGVMMFMEGAIAAPEDETMPARIEDAFGESAVTSAAEVVRLVNGSAQKGTITGSEAYIYSFTAASAGSYVFFTTGSTNTNGTLYSDSDLKTVLKSNDNSGEENNFRIEQELTKGQTVYLKVTGAGTSTGEFTVRGSRKYTISFDANGGSGAPEAQEKLRGVALILPTIIPVRSGYTFLGWSTDRNAMTAEYAAGDSFSKDADTTLYAVMKRETSDFEKNPKHLLNIFEKVICCGDSYTNGSVWNPVTQKFTPHSEKRFSWVRYMEKLTGSTWLNCGVGSTTVRSWQTDELGLPMALSYGKAQGYVLAWGINDSSSGSRHVDVGTVSDIGTDADTFFGNYSKIITSLLEVSSNAKIFILTCPQVSYFPPIQPYNAAVRELVSALRANGKTNIHCIDLEAYSDLYDNDLLSQDRLKDHYTNIGYEYFAEVLYMILNDYMESHITEFQDVAFIEYD